MIDDDETMHGEFMGIGTCHVCGKWHYLYADIYKGDYVCRWDWSKRGNKLDESEKVRPSLGKETRE